MKALLSVLFVVIFTQNAFAKVLYTCTSSEPTSLFSEIVLSDLGGTDYFLTISKVDSIGKKIEQSAVAIYYDDMTYLGYYSEILSASLEFNYPVNLSEKARFQLGETLVYVNCK